TRQARNLCASRRPCWPACRDTSRPSRSSSDARSCSRPRGRASASWKTPSSSVVPESPSNEPQGAGKRSMAASDKKIQPIIVKKIKKASHGHHGGAWKIAYADFVTAMMAFFLLMWLLGSTTKGDLKGIADHFSTPLHVALNAGSGSGDSSSIINGGGTDLTRSVGQVKRGESEARERTVNPHALARENRRIESRRLRALRERVESVVASDPTLADMRKHLRMDLTSEGLRIQIVDDRQRPMFDSGGAEVKY